MEAHPRKCKKKYIRTVKSNIKNKTAVNILKKKGSCAVDTTKTPSKKFAVLNYLNNISYGDYTKPEMKNFQKTCIVNHLPDLVANKIISPFCRRVTSIVWHPKYPKIFAAGSKGGELLLLNLLSSSSSFIPGIGPGGSIVGLKFTLDEQCCVYTASITGKIRRECFLNKDGKTFLSTNCFRNWFTSLDVSLDKKLILAGDCFGSVWTVATDNAEEAGASQFKRLHKDKVSHIEWSLLDPNIFVTASIDHTAKIWDFRMLSGSAEKPNPVCTFYHAKGVNSAYFSPSNRSSLLTTDQKNEIRVYKSPGWTEELVIKHPHRQFQHLTPIKASWHPFEDIIVVGRYPDDDFKKCDDRTVDYFDGSTGYLLHRSPSLTGGIACLNAFNITGDHLASASGGSLSFMAHKDQLNRLPTLVGEI